MSTISSPATLNNDLHEPDCDCSSNPPGTKYYVSVVRDGGAYRLLAGPFDDHQAALNMVDQTTRLAHDLDRQSIWYGFGTCCVRPPGPFPAGILNTRLDLEACAT